MRFLDLLGSYVTHNGDLPTSHPFRARHGKAIAWQGGVFTVRAPDGRFFRLREKHAEALDEALNRRAGAIPQSSSLFT